MKIVVGMSGGVDSAVAALLLKQQGHDVVGVFMKNWNEEDESATCPAEADWRDVRSICRQINIPYYSVNFTKEYYDRVFTNFLDEYKAGRTPNPDVLCNREIKFKAFLDYAIKSGADKIATGHFVRTNEDGALLKGLDLNKDQSYFLYMLKKDQLKKALFPVGELSKTKVREIAQNNNIPVFNKKDSTGVCFIGERNFKKFLSGFIPAKPGDVCTKDGKVIGRHDGLMYYTIGQRKGLGIGGFGDGRSIFIIDKDLKNNRLIVGQGEEHPGLYANCAEIENITFVGNEPSDRQIELNVKCRYRQCDQKAVLCFDDNNKEKGQLHFETSQRAITPGQSAVFYQGDKCLGGGIIIKAIKK